VLLLPSMTETTTETRAPARADPNSLPALLPWWLQSLEARGLSPQTVKSYRVGTEQFAAYLAGRGMPTSAEHVTREHVESWLVSLRDAGSAPATSATRHRAVQQFYRWCVEDGIVAEESNPLRHVRAPLVPEQPVPTLSLDQLKALLATCTSGPVRDRSYPDVRDEAVIRLFADSGLRRQELASLRLEDVDLVEGLATVVGKGSRRRTVPFQSKTASSLRRYLRLRNQRPDADLPQFWLAQRGAFAASGIAQMVSRRAVRAGLGPVHPHQIRHSWADHAQASGIGEGNLMRLGGWRSRQMVDRYGASNAARRALEAARDHSLGEKL
jgi:integrase/recombinase XerC